MREPNLSVLHFPSSFPYAVVRLLMSDSFVFKVFGVYVGMRGEKDEVSRVMSRAWIHFAHDLNPNGPDRESLIFFIHPRMALVTFTN